MELQVKDIFDGTDVSVNGTVIKVGNVEYDISNPAKLNALSEAMSRKQAINVLRNEYAGSDYDVVVGKETGEVYLVKKNANRK